METEHYDLKLVHMNDAAHRLEDLAPARQFLAEIPIEYAKEQQVLVMSDGGDRLCLLTTLMTRPSAIDQMRRMFGYGLASMDVPNNVLEAQINLAYESQSSRTRNVIQDLSQEPVDFEISSGQTSVDLLGAVDRAPIVQLVNSILLDAIRQRASDIHVQPCEEQLEVRFRIDGMLFEQFAIPKARQEEVLSRFKIIGRMNIAEKRLPQDGRATVRVGNRIIDLRIASLPSLFGERIVLRLLDKSARLYSLSELGMTSRVFSEFNRVIHLEHGIVLVTGPTGSGKSTTLYAALQEIDSKNRNIVTLEDPVEYQIEGISQTQINEKKGLTFASGLKSVLRQDPDVIMVGEIRDEDTAKMAIQSALTGHIVFTTLHTNDAPSAVARLLDLGIEPYLVASSVVGVLAQRLVRKICVKCIRTVPARDLLTAGSDLDRLLAQKGIVNCFVGAGCEQCRQTGYYGRVGLFELLIVTDPIRSAIQRRCNASEIRQQALQDGLQLMQEDGVQKIQDGTTSIDEVLRVSQRISSE